MERLTKRGYKKQALLIGTSCSYGYMSYDCKLKEGNVLLKSALDKLADYEDLEEQGRLVKLPCKVGDNVWVIMTGMTGKHPALFRQSFELSMLKHWGTSVFLIKSEAEAKLKELRGNND